VNVLVFNPGSASLKFDIIAMDVPPCESVIRGKKLVSGVVEPIGGPAKLSLLDQRKAVPQQDLSAADHGQAADAVLAWMDAGQLSSHGVTSTKAFDIIGYRVVHGGKSYFDPVRIDDEVIARIEAVEEIAPLHNAASVSVIRAVRKSIGETTPSVAVFDTGFHRTIPERASIYAIPWELTLRHGIRRYGFHGISHNYLLWRYSELTGAPLEKTNIITLHLEGGSSATAVAAGRSIDTSMGFTPLEGLVMGTRSGDLDPALVAFLARKENVSVDTVEKWLNKKSGLLGISERSQDTRILVQHVMSDERARLALDIFSYRVRKYIGAYLSVIGNATAVVFGGGIGENTPYVRQLICDGLDWLGLRFDPERNATLIDREGEISHDDSRLHAFVIPSEEGLMIAHQALRCWSMNS
jgi:acetate kinase